MSLKNIAREVLNVIEQGYYEVGKTDHPTNRLSGPEKSNRVSIEGACQIAIEGSRLYSDAEVRALREKSNANPSKDSAAPQILMIDATTQQAAHWLSQQGPVVLLNFASARSAGGGFLNGAKAQEEDICRCSALYPAIVQHQEYYDVNRNYDSLLYTDYLIYTPTVPFFKTRGTGEYLPRPFFASVITAPAPNMRPYLAADGDPKLLHECFARRWRNVLAVAQEHRDKTLLLGAWGCGAFGGDPESVSLTAYNAISEFGYAFEKIVFAIPSKGKQSKHNLAVFSNQFGLTPQKLT